jgi:hypothetical protein
MRSPYRHATPGYAPRSAPPSGTSEETGPTRGHPPQPEWSPDGVLHFVSDRSGWWNLYRWHHGQVEAVLTAEAEMGAAPWEFGYATYAFLRDDSIAVLLQNGPTTQLTLLRPDGTLTPIVLPYTSIKPYLATHGRARRPGQRRRTGTRRRYSRWAAARNRLGVRCRPGPVQLPDSRRLRPPTASTTPRPTRRSPPRPRRHR